MADAVDLHDRMPATWRAVQDLVIEDWVARKIATLAHDLNDDAATEVDAAIATKLNLPTSRLLTVTAGRVNAADPALANAKAEAARRRRGLWLSRCEDGTRSLIARCDAADATRVFETCDQIARLLAQANNPAQDPQDPRNLDQLRAAALGLLADPQAAAELLAGRDPRRGKAIIYAHLAASDLDHPDPTHAHAVARVEDLGPHTLNMLKTLLGHDHITLKPVIDLNTGAAADGYEIPTGIAEQVHLTKPADCFPYAGSLQRGLDLDHTNPYQRHQPPQAGAPPGQTRVDNLGKLTRRHHRIKTHAPGWKVEQLPGHRYLWTTPHGRHLLVDADGTHPVPSTHTTSPMQQRLEATHTDFIHAA